MHVPSTLLFAWAVILSAGIAGKAGLRAESSLVMADGRAAVRQDLPDGPGKDAVIRLCDDCHDLIFTMSTRETRDGWTRVVNDMRSRGTDGTEAEFEQVITYLTTHMGKAEGEAHAALELLANRTRVAPGEHFSLGLRLVAVDGWHIRVAAGRSPQITWMVPPVVSIGDADQPSGDAPRALAVVPARVLADAAPGSTLDLVAHVTYEVCRDTCVTETARTSVALPIGEGGRAVHENEFGPGAGTARH